MTTKQYINRVHTSTKLSPKDASWKKRWIRVQNFIRQMGEKNPKFQLNDLVRTADLKRTLSKSDTTNCFFKLYRVTEIYKDTITS